MHAQPITWLCGCESTIRINGTPDEGRIVAAYYAQYACHGHDPTRKPVSWLGREGVAFVVEEVRREERTDCEPGLRLPDKTNVSFVDEYNPKPTGAISDADWESARLTPASFAMTNK